MIKIIEQRAKVLYMDPLSSQYRRQLNALLKVGYVITEPFNHIYSKSVRKPNSDQYLYRQYNGAIKLEYKGE